MMLHIPAVVEGAMLDAFQDLSRREDIYDHGGKTAGWHARNRKNNLQADAANPLVAGMLKKVEQLVLQNSLVQSAARPKKLARLVLSRYHEGMSYGDHVDDAFIGGVRTDLSFTLFLDPPDSYGGGALVIDEPAGEREVKLEAGSLFIYPSTALHRVERVTRGTRTAVVGWLCSYVRDAHQREMLFDLDRAIAALRAEHGDEGQPLALLLKTRSNLLRLWADS